MKKIFALFAVAATALPLATTRTEAQNIQIHYDIGREAVTSTVEMFRPDGGGSTFFFIDFDYTPKACGAYFEISREICFWQKSRLDWLSAHIEYNGGLSTSAGSFNNAWLAGATYSGHSEDFSKTWSLTAAYKAILKIFLNPLAPIGRIAKKSVLEIERANKKTIPSRLEAQSKSLVLPKTRSSLVEK